MSKNEVKRAIRRQFLQIRPEVVLDSSGYTRTIEDNLVEGVRVGDFEADLRGGGGGELESSCGKKPKFYAVHSSSALAVNCFAPFKRCLSDLYILSGTNYKKIKFEEKCPTGLRGTPPHLDIVVKNNKTVIGIESKLTESLDVHMECFSSRYETERNNCWCDVWFKHMKFMQENKERYKYLNAAQLIKHAFGIRNTFPGNETKLLYLYWEPTNAGQYQNFTDHQNEINDFYEKIDGSMPSFHFMSYLDLWNKWDNNATPDWLKDHVKNLRARYEIKIP